MGVSGLLFSFLFVYGRSYFLNKNRAETFHTFMMDMEMPTQVVGLEEVEKFFNFDFDQFGNEFIIAETYDEQTKSIKIKNMNTGETIVIVEKRYCEF